MIEGLFTRLWRFDVDGREVEVENRWNLLWLTRERLFVDGELMAQNRGWINTHGPLVARVRGRSGMKEVSARLTGETWRVRCDLDVADCEMGAAAAPQTDGGPWGPRPA